MKYINCRIRSFNRCFSPRLIFAFLPIYLGFLVVGSLVSCQAIQRRIVGLGDPNESITKEEAIKFGTEYGFDPRTIVFTRDADSAMVYELKYCGAPSLHIFDKHGRLVKYKEDSQDCRAGADDFLMSLNPTTVYETSQLKDQSIIWKYLEDKAPGYMDDTADFNIYITWSKWMGNEITEANAGAWVKAIGKNEKARLQVILVNLDRIKL